MNGSRKNRTWSAFALIVALGAALLAGAPAWATGMTSPEIAMSHNGVGQSSGPFAAPRSFVAGLGWNACSPGELCLFVEVDGGGGGFAWAANGATSDFRTLVCRSGQGCYPGTFDNEASSWWNRTGQTFCVSDGYNGGNPDNTMPPGTRGNFTTTGWNDRPSSLGYLGCP
ncbi:peptidase inhibitor family I36 protein [Umezawaea endophytica]|uniref:Peptidase inhibitor family I36 protein n=1 Tax=Umezawaea endophytica TaxID=1654476 RepID=A0A9X2VVI4_9PSEU|nr:peptidase inhibitor family I36 protein [Umezawaea endophytica]MCS7483715.1 peptidase inhibitor family I36 protein [Umezawaea endophytica]